MILVTGGAGFIGSNIIKALNKMGEDSILVTDDLENGDKFVNLVGLNFVDYIDYRELAEVLPKLSLRVIFHEGACSSTTERNGRRMLQQNYDYSKMLLTYAVESKTRFIYASSASIYGDGKNGFMEIPECESPLNVYAFSKYLFDRYVLQLMDREFTQIVGLRYFNVYGPNEQHKGNMASVAYHLYKKVINGEAMELFEGSNNFLRDFIYVEDVADVNLFFMENRDKSGIFNCGTGKAESFMGVADAMKHIYKDAKLRLVPFPKELEGKYQKYTQANIAKLHSFGYNKPFHSVKEGVEKYMAALGAK
jgi:ADP-L-glycero-D-manno-heptose 6-epimerase